MNIKLPLLWAYLATSLLLLACTDRKPELSSGAKAASAGTTSTASTDQWLGQWNGPEGTFLRIAGGGGKYQITIQDLDGPHSYQGSSRDGTIQFERNGAVESIRSTNGAQTGMKWLADKTNCLTVRVGEGYCRD